MYNTGLVESGESGEGWGGKRDGRLIRRRSLWGVEGSIGQRPIVPAAVAIGHHRHVKKLNVKSGTCEKLQASFMSPIQ